MSVVKYVDQFGYNEHDVCVEGAINVLLLKMDNSKIHAEAYVSKGQRGWVIGTRYDCKYDAMGFYGSCSGCFYDAVDQYETQEEATNVVHEQIINQLQTDLSKAPDNIKKHFINAIKVLETQMQTKAVFRTETKTEIIKIESNQLQLF